MVSSYSALFTVRCGALSYSSSTFNGTCVNAPHRTANNAEYELTFSLIWGYSPTFNVYFNLILSLLRFMIADAAWSQTKSPILGALGDDSSQMKCLLVPLWWLITALILSSLFLLLVGEETAKTTLNSMFRWLELTSGVNKWNQLIEWHCWHKTADRCNCDDWRKTPSIYNSSHAVLPDRFFSWRHKSALKHVSDTTCSKCSFKDTLRFLRTNKNVCDSKKMEWG